MKTNRTKRLPTKVFAKAGLDNVTSAMCKYQQRFGLDVPYSALVHNFNNIFSNGHLDRAGQSMNSRPSQILELGYFMKTSIIITFLFFGISLNIFGQNRYEQFKNYFSDSLRQRNKGFSCIRTYQQKTGDKKHLVNIIYFNSEGLPKLTQMEDTIGILFSIEEFQKKKQIFDWRT